jgi:NitT/TauT family transport system substrate-binding protein
MSTEYSQRRRKIMETQKKRVPPLVAGLLVIALVLAAGSAPAGAAEVPALTLGHVGHDHQIAVYVAADEGQALEERYGVYLKPLKDREVYDLVDGGRIVARVRMIRVGGGSGMPAAMERGDIDVGLGGLGPVAKFVDRGAPLKVLAPLNNDGDALVLRPDIPAGDWKTFVEMVKGSEKPVRLGYKAPMAVAYMILTKALAEEGLSFGQEPVGKDGKPVQVLTVNLQGAQNMVPAMEAGAVDGVVINEPKASLLVHKGLGRKVADLSRLPPRGKWEGHPCCVVAATEEVLLEKREAVKSLLKLIVAGADVMAVDPEKAFAAEARWTKTPPPVGRMSIPEVSYVIRPDVEWREAVDTWIELMLSMNRFDKNFRALPKEEIRRTLVDLDPLSEVLDGMDLESEKRQVPGE